MKRILGLIALAATLAFGGAAIAQDKKADAPPAPAAAAAPADAKAPADAAKPADAKPAEAAAAAAPAAAPAPTPNKGDTAWMLTSTALVLMMSVPALALFYGGMVRSKNMLSMLMQVFVVFSLVTVLWCIYGYSVGFTQGSGSLSPFFGGFDRLFLKGTFDSATGNFSMAATFSKGTPLYELVYVAFQATFAAITCCLILGAIAERAKFSAVLLFIVLWFTFSYLPVAHMVWYWAGPDAFTDAKAGDAATLTAGLLNQ
ncbi:MAG TPA: ammonia channel protein, partial [Usitatibacter sp.]|nr:ammonia channel protein [Usitatibacter sp.]